MPAALTSDGAWSIHQRPRAVGPAHPNNPSNKTFVGWTSSNGDIGVTRYDHDTDEVSHTTLDPNFEVDDHCSPAIHVRGDGRLVIFWTEHTRSPMYWRISDNAADISSFGTTQSFSASSAVDYPQPIPWNGNIRLYYRFGGSSSPWRYRVSSDGAGSFGSPNTLFSDPNEQRNYTHPYLDTSGSNDRLHFAMGDHRMTNTGIYHWFLENGDYYESDGTLIQSADNPLTSVSDLTTIYDGAASGNNPAKQYDLICDSSGNPYVAFIEHVETGTGGGDGDYRARASGWDGSQWVVGGEITPTGGALPEDHYYEAGISLDSQDPSTAYVGVEVNNRNYQIQEWTTNDYWATSTKVQDLSQADATITNPTKRGRPISPRGHNGSELTATWWAGMYDGYTNYETQVMADGVTVETSTGAMKYIRQDGQWVEFGQS